MSKTYDKSGGHSSEAGDAKGSGQSDASATKSYHNGGVEGDQFSKWFDANLANEVTVMQRPDGAAASESREYQGSGSGGTSGDRHGKDHEWNGKGNGHKGSGSGGTKGSGSGGTKGSGTGGTTSGHGQWGGENAAAAANALPPFEDYEVDSVGTNEITLNDVMSLMTKDMDAVDQDDGNDGTPVDWTGSELL